MKIEEMIEEGRVPNAEELRDLHGRYPYWLLPDLAVLEDEGAVAELPEDEALLLKRRIAASIGDTDALERLLGPVSGLFDDFYGDLHPSTPSTEATIDAFLDQYGGSKYPDPLAQAGVPGDYAAYLERTEAQPMAAPAPEPAAQAEDEDLKASESTTPLTESLAYVMIKNGNYEKALEIISTLNLNNPQKSAYFADQIRFLRKLILNEKRKQN